MKRVILDTNFLMIPYSFKVDIFSEIDRICNFKYQIYIIDRTIDELNNIIKKQTGKHKQAAKLGLSLAKAYKTKPRHSVPGFCFYKTKPLKSNNENQNRSVDDIILDMADRDTIVATQDKILKKRLKEKGVAVIVLRQKKHLELVGYKNVLQG